jgi:hypothetical protein
MHSCSTACASVCEALPSKSTLSAFSTTRTIRSLYHRSSRGNFSTRLSYRSPPGRLKFILQTCIHALSAASKDRATSLRPGPLSCLHSSCIHSPVAEMNERKSWLGSARGTARHRRRRLASNNQKTCRNRSHFSLAVIYTANNVRESDAQCDANVIVEAQTLPQASRVWVWLSAVSAVRQFWAMPRSGLADRRYLIQRTNCGLSDLNLCHGWSRGLRGLDIFACESSAAIVA